MSNERQVLIRKGKDAKLHISGNLRSFAPSPKGIGGAASGHWAPVRCPPVGPSQVDFEHLGGLVAACLHYVKPVYRQPSSPSLDCSCPSLSSRWRSITAPSRRQPSSRRGYRTFGRRSCGRASIRRRCHSAQSRNGAIFR